MNDEQISTSDPSRQGSHDGTSAGDHDRPYAGFRSYQFNTRQLVRLLQLRSELLEARLGHGRWAEDLGASA